MRSFFITVSIFLLCVSVTFAQRELQHDRIPLNSSVLQGKLNNGLKYYILRNSNPANKICFSLQVDVGYDDELSEQYGVAHLIEHLAFRRTNSFPAGIKNFLTGKGLKFGADFNATTGERTNYELTIPSDDPEMLRNGFMILRDFASGVSFIPEDIEEERAAVLKEASRSDNPEFISQLEAKYLQLDENPLYAINLSGQMLSIKSVTRKALIKFYKDWYHPIHQVIYVVGDVDQKQIEELIKQNFSDLKNTGVKSKKPVSKLYSVQLSDKNRLFIVNHGDSRQTVNFEIQKKIESSSRQGIDGTTEEYFHSLRDRLVSDLMRQRMEFAAELQKALPVFGSNIIRGAIDRRAGIDAVVTKQFIADAQDVKPSILFILNELERIARFGFTEKEFHSAKESIIVAQKDVPQGSRQLISRLSQYHFAHKAFPDGEKKLQLEMLKSITLKDVNTEVMAWLRSKGNIDIVVSVPSFETPGIPTQIEIDSLILELQSSVLLPLTEPKSKSFKFSVPDSSPATQYQIDQITELNVTRLKFNNGATVLIKTLPHSQYQADRAMLFGYRKSMDIGLLTNTYPYIRDVRSFLGFDSLGMDDLTLFQKNHNKLSSELYGGPSFSDDEIIFSAEATTDNLEPLMQMCYLYIAKPFMDRIAFSDYCEKLDNLSRIAKLRDAQTVVQDSIEAIIRGKGGPYQHVVFSDSLLCQHQGDKVFQIYKENWSDIAGFNFVITGQFDIDYMIDLTSKYIGALQGKPVLKPDKPVSNKPIVNSSFLPGAQMTIVGDSVNNVVVRLLFSGKYEQNPKNRVAFEVASAALNILLLDRLREKEKGVYALFSNLRFSRISNDFFLDISFEAAPKEVDRLIDAVKDQINLFGKGQLDEGTFRNSIDAVRLKIVSNSNSALFWQMYLTDQINKGVISDEDLQTPNLLENLTLKDVTGVIDQYLNPSEYMLFKIP